MRKPYKTPTPGESGRKPQAVNDLCESRNDVLSGRNTRKRVYLETR